MNSQDSVYDRSKPRDIVADQGEPGIRYDYMGPFANVQDAVINQALNSMVMPREAIQEMVRPKLPQVMLFRETKGYRTRALGITDVINVDEEFQPTRVDFTGGRAGYEGTLRNAQGQGFW